MLHTPNKKSFSQTFGNALCQIANEDPRVCAITAAMEQGTGLAMFAQLHPSRYFDVGIAEGHAVAMAAGMAKQGLIPVFAVYSTFLQRAYDMLLHDVALLNLHVVFAVDRAGLVGEDGETHHGLFDVGFLHQVSGMQILCPASQAELQWMLRKAIFNMSGPVAVRYPKGTDGVYSREHWSHQIHDGASLTILTYGYTINPVLQAVELLQQDGIAVDVIKLDQIVPLDYNAILPLIRKTGRILVVEETAQSGCVGDALVATLSCNNERIICKRMNYGNGIVPHGDLNSLRHLMG